MFQLELLFSEEEERSTPFIVWDLALVWPAENISAGAWPPARSYPHQPYHHLPGQGTAVNTWGWMYLQRPVLALKLVDQLCGYVHRGSLQPVSAAVPHQLSLCLWVRGVWKCFIFFKCWIFGDFFVSQISTFPSQLLPLLSLGPVLFGISGD